MGGISKSWSDEGELDGWQSDMACVFSSWIPLFFLSFVLFLGMGQTERSPVGREKGSISVYQKVSHILA
jgi:hypothetical protein